MIPFRDRHEAGRILAGYFSEYTGRNDIVVLALPRGGVPVGCELARALQAPLDVLTVRKLGASWNPQLAFGAVGTDGLKWIDKAMLVNLEISETETEYTMAKECAELKRVEQTFRSAHHLPQIKGKTVILVDDGLSTGVTMGLAVEMLRQRSPEAIIAAAPVVSNEAWARLSVIADACVCVINPSPFYGVGMWYTDFNEVTESEIIWDIGRANQVPAKVANL